MQLARFFLLKLFSFILIFLSTSCVKKTEIQPLEYYGLAKSQNISGSVFKPIKIAKFTSKNIPCILVRIGGKLVSAELDLGFQGNFSCSTEFLNTVDDKILVGTRTMYGFRGKQYEKNVYKIPYITIGEALFADISLQEDIDEFRTNANVKRSDSVASSDEPARLGWEIFRIFNLFLDLGNSKAAFCTGFSALVEQGYSPESFVSTPLYTDRGFIEFIAQTEIGPLRCMLDTGSTWNILNQRIEEAKTIDQIAWDPKSIMNVREFTISERGFGTVQFHCLPIELPIKVDAILGMDFFINNLVFIDFTNQSIYISSK